MKYLIQIDNALHGYNDFNLLKIDVLIKKPNSFKLFVLRKEGLTNSWDEVSQCEIEAIFPKVFRQSAEK